MMQSPAQVSLRPNNRLSDMQAIMEQTQAFENRVLERLNAGKTVRSFLIAAVELLTEAVNILVLQEFDDSDPELYMMQKLRYQQVVRSTMVLSLTELISKISLKKAFQK